jgi:hypothetical protein
MSFMWAGLYNTNGNGLANVTAIATGTQAQTFSTAGCGGVPGVNSTCFIGNPATSLFFGQERINKWEIGANYALGPGVKLTGGAILYTAGGPTNLVSGNSWAFLLVWTCASSRRPTSIREERAKARSFCLRPRPDGRRC